MDELTVSGGNLTPVHDMMHVGDGIVVVVGDVEDVVVVVVVEDVINLTIKITRSAHTKFQFDRRKDSNYKHILIEITKLRGLWLLVCTRFPNP